MTSRHVLNLYFRVCNCVWCVSRGRCGAVVRIKAWAHPPLPALPRVSQKYSKQFQWPKREMSHSKYSRLDAQEARDSARKTNHTNPLRPILSCPRLHLPLRHQKRRILRMKLRLHDMCHTHLGNDPPRPLSQPLVLHLKHLPRYLGSNLVQPLNYNCRT